VSLLARDERIGSLRQVALESLDRPPLGGELLGALGKRILLARELARAPFDVGLSLRDRSFRSRDLERRRLQPGKTLLEPLFLRLDLLLSLGDAELRVPGGLAPDRLLLLEPRGLGLELRGALLELALT
jgi:hypothetical protein